MTANSQRPSNGNDIQVEVTDNDNHRHAVNNPEATGKYEIIVQDKKGFFTSAIPDKLPCCVAIFCCFLNCVIPGIGTLISAFFSLCEEKEKNKKVRNFCVNILAGFLQLILAVVLIGWFWSILWAIEFLKPLKGEGYENS